MKKQINLKFENLSLQIYLANASKYWFSKTEISYSTQDYKTNR